MKLPHALAIWFAILISYPAHGAGPESMPAACDVLRAVDVEEILGDGTVFEETVSRQNGQINLTQCSAIAAGDAVRSITLLLRKDAGDAVVESTRQREVYVAELEESLGVELQPVDVDLGESAIWIDDFQQLTIWHRDGHLMMILSGHGDALQEASFTVGRRIVERYP